MPNTCDDIVEYKRYLRAIERALPPAAHCASIILGNWNFVHMGGGRLTGRGAFGPGGRSQRDACQEICGH
eukprot:8047271-Pyramimonas_sp.AAC.1